MIGSSDGEFSFPCDEIGTGAPALLLSALSSISTRQEMRPLAERLSDRLRCVVPDWPGFGGGGRVSSRLSSTQLDAFLYDVLAELGSRPAIGIAAGHGAPYLVKAAARHPGRLASWS